MTDVIYSASLNDKQVLAALKRIDTNIDKIANQGAKSFGGIQQSASASGVQIGAVAGVVASLTSEFLALGKAAISTLTEIGKEGVSLAAKMEVNRGMIANIFQGDEQAATAVIDRLIEKGSKIGLLPEAAVGLGTSFLPDVGSIEQLDRIIEAAVKLRTLAPEKSIEDIRQALEQGLSGDALALQDRLNLPPEVRGRIKELQAEFGKTEGLLKALDEVFTKFGINLEDVSNTAIGKFGIVQAELQGVQLAGSQPILDELKEQLDDLGDVLIERGDDFDLIAASVGDVVANVIDFVGSGLTDFLQNLDTDQVLEITQNIFEMTEKARELAGILDVMDFATSFVDNLSFGVDKLNEALTTAIQLSALAKAVAAQEAAEREAFARQVAAEQGGEGFLSGVARLPGLGSAAADLTTQIGTQQNADEIRKAGEDAYRKSLEESLKVMEESSQRTEENRQKIQERREEQERSNVVGEQAADSFLKQQQAVKDLAKAEGELAEAQSKVNEEFGKAEQDFQRKLEDIDRETERKRLDILIEFARKRVDAAKDNLEKLADIQTKYSQDVDDAATDLSRKEEDIARKQGEERIDLEREQRQKRVDIETTFRQRLQDIQSQFLTDAEDAERKRDAVAFLKAVRDRDKQVQGAQTDRSREIEESRTTGEQKRQELAIQQERELEEARIANDRKLEDLKTNLDRQIEAQNTAYARQLDDLVTAEERKNEELNTWRERELEDARTANARKLEDLQASLAEELAIIEDYAAKKAELMKEVSAPSSTFNSKYSNPDFVVPSGTSHQPAKKAPPKPVKSIYGFASGGAFTVGGTGGTDSQLVQFMASPNERVYIHPPGGMGGTSNVNNSRQINLSVPPDRLTPGQRSEARQLALEILREAL